MILVARGWNQLNLVQIFFFFVKKNKKWIFFAPEMKEAQITLDGHSSFFVVAFI